MTMERLLVFAGGLALAAFIVSGLYTEAVLPLFQTVQDGLAQAR